MDVRAFGGSWAGVKHAQNRMASSLAVRLRVILRAMEEKLRYRISRSSRAVPHVERAPLCVNQTEAVKVIGSPKLLHDLEAEGLIVPLNEGKPKWYSVVNLQRAVLEKVHRNQAARTNSDCGDLISQRAGKLGTYPSI